MVNSRERLLAAAAREFAARGYAGASVDRIARAARLNKAMIYYHFRSKAELYRTIVREVFEAVLAALSAGDEPGADPGVRLERFVRAIAGVVASRPHFPAMWLAEFAGGLRHVDEPTVRTATEIVGFLRKILSAGEAAGRFRPVSSVLVHIGIVAPMMLFAVSAPARERLARAGAAAAGARGLTLDDVVQHVVASTVAALSVQEGEHHA